MRFIKTFTFMLIVVFSLSICFALPENIYNDEKIQLSPGLNIICIDLGGPENSERADGAFGDATLIEQNGNYLLIDTGTNDTNDTIIKFLKAQEVNKLSIYISHYHVDHYGKLKSIINDSYFTVEHVYLPDIEVLTSKFDDSKEWNSEVSPYLKTANNLSSFTKSHNIDTIFCKKGTTINIGEAVLKVIWDGRECSLDPDKLYSENPTSFKNIFINDTSLVSTITYKGIKYLTAGDIEVIAEKDIIKAGIDIKSDIFKFSHHGSPGSNCDEFVDEVNPKYAYFPNNYTAGKNTILWYGDRSKGKYRAFVDNLGSKTNLLSTLYNGTFVYNISPKGVITTDIIRNYNTLTIKYLDIETESKITKEKQYYFNDRSVYHLDSAEYIKTVKDYDFITSNYEPNNVLTKNATITCYYKSKDSSLITGDLNGDKTITIMDCRLLLQYYINLDSSTNYTQKDLYIMDLNNDKTINILDVRLLLQKYLNGNNLT